MQARQDSLKVSDHPIKFMAVDGTSLAYIERGDGEPVVFVHGAITDLRIWLDQVEHFSKTHRAIAYSRRMHWPGEKVQDDGPYLRASHTRDLVSFLEGLDLKQAHLVGHSFGGAVALLTALERPDLVASLVLGEPSPIVGLFENGDVDPLARQKIGFDEAVLLARRGNLESAVRQFLNVIVGADVLEQLSKVAREVVLDNAVTLVPMLEHYYESPPVSPESLEALEMPTLLISGEFSPRLAVIGNSKLHACLPDSQETVLDATSHGLHIENPAGFAQVVDDFLIGASSTTATRNGSRLMAQ